MQQPLEKNEKGEEEKTVSWNYNKITTQGDLKTLKHYKHASQWPPPTREEGHLGPSS